MKKIFALLLALAMLFSLAACTSGQEPSANTPDAPAKDSADKNDGYTIAMLPMFKGENYFDGCHVGAKQAAEDLGVTLVYDGPNQSESTNAKQVEILEGFIAAGVDAIVVSPCDAEGIAPTLRKAAEQGIKVVAFDSDSAVDSRAFYVNAAAPSAIGKALVDVAVKDLEALGRAGQPTRVALISGTGLDVNQNEWILALIAYMKENYPWMTVDCDESGYLGGDIWTPGSDEAAAQVAAAETLALAGSATDGSELNVIIGTSSMHAPALAAAWNSMVGEKPDVVMTGLATPLSLVDYILDEENPLNYGVLWDVNDLGYLAIEATVALLNGELDDATDGTVFKSKLGDKEFVINAEDGGLELMLGDALTFGADTVEDYNY